MTQYSDRKEMQQCSRKLHVYFEVLQPPGFSLYILSCSAYSRLHDLEARYMMAPDSQYIPYCLLSPPQKTRGFLMDKSLIHKLVCV